MESSISFSQDVKSRAQRQHFFCVADVFRAPSACLFEILSGRLKMEFRPDQKEGNANVASDHTEVLPCAAVAAALAVAPAEACTI